MPQEKQFHAIQAHMQLWWELAYPIRSRKRTALAFALFALLQRFLKKEVTQQEVEREMRQAERHVVQPEELAGFDELTNLHAPEALPGVLLYEMVDMLYLTIYDHSYEPHYLDGVEPHIAPGSWGEWLEGESIAVAGDYIWDLKMKCFVHRDQLTQFQLVELDSLLSRSRPPL